MKDSLRVLAVCSGGGHWVQMKRLTAAFEGHDVTYATVGPWDPGQLSDDRIVRIPDANRDTKVRLLFLLARLAWLVLWTRPHVVVSTGAAPGYIAIRMGRLIGAKTLFLDSIANTEKLSLSAEMSLKHADVTLTQWQHMANQQGPEFWGAVL